MWLQRALDQGGVRVQGEPLINMPGAETWPKSRHAPFLLSCYYFTSFWCVALKYAEWLGVFWRIEICVHFKKGKRLEELTFLVWNSFKIHVFVASPFSNVSPNSIWSFWESSDWVLYTWCSTLFQELGWNCHPIPALLERTIKGTESKSSVFPRLIFHKVCRSTCVPCWWW